MPPVDDHILNEWAKRVALQLEEIADLPAERRVTGHGGGTVSGEVAVPPPWRRWAACRDTYHPGFFPEGLISRQPVETALRICQGCPVIGQCADYARQHRISLGIWGGMTNKQRRRKLNL